MTDLISRLADELIALNNASPRLPRKDQIEDVLRKGMEAYDAERQERAEAMLQLALETASITCTVTSQPIPDTHTLTWAEIHAIDSMNRCWDSRHYSDRPYGKCFCGATEIGS